MANAQGFIQPLAQANTPSSVNNGNPNTVYNTPQTGAQRPLQGWTITQPVAANIDLGNVANDAITQSNQMIKDRGWIAPETTAPTVPLMAAPEQGWMTAPGQTTGGGATTAPAPAPAPAPAVDTSNWQWVVMNGKVPGMNQQLYNSDPAYKAAWDQAVAEHQNQFKKGYTKDSSVQAITERLKQLYTQYSGGSVPSQSGSTGRGVAGNANGWLPNSQSTQQWVNNLAQGGVPVIDGSKGWASTTGGDPAKMSQAVDRVVQQFTSLGDKLNTSSIMQFIDAITEPFLPGNLYMSELGQVNGPNVMEAVLNKMIPGVGTLAQKILNAIPENATGLLGKMRQWVKEGKFQELANEVYKNVRKDNQQRVTTGGLDASLGSSGHYGVTIGGWMGTGGGYGGTGTVTVGPISNPDNEEAVRKTSVA